MCQYCDALKLRVAIKSPDQLSNVLLRAADYLASGVLADISRDYAQHDFAMSFAECGYTIETAASNKRRLFGWHDFVCHYFQCIHCHAVFSLNAETYHGSGGEWKLEEMAARAFQAA